MGTIKGENLRILVGEDAEHLKCVAASTNCQVHLALQVEEDTTKDTDDDWVMTEPVGINWDASVDALVIIDTEDTGGAQLASLVVGQVYVLRFSQTAGATGEQNRDAVDTAMQLTGSAILQDLQVNATNEDISTYTAKFAGTGDLTRYTPLSNSEIGGGSQSSEIVGA